MAQEVFSGTQPGTMTGADSSTGKIEPRKRLKRRNALLLLLTGAVVLAGVDAATSFLLPKAEAPSKTGDQGQADLDSRVTARIGPNLAGDIDSFLSLRDDEGRPLFQANLYVDLTASDGFVGVNGGMSSSGLGLSGTLGARDGKSIADFQVLDRRQMLREEQEELKNPRLP